MATANAIRNSEQNWEKLFPLDAPEFAVDFRNGTKQFRHIFRRISAADWQAYWSALVLEPADESNGTAQNIRDDDASLILYERTILRVEGYYTLDGRKPEELPSWPKCISLEHRLFAIEILLETLGSVAWDTVEVGADNTVSFVVIRGDAESSDSRFIGVTHHFCKPKPDQYQRFLHAVGQAPSNFIAVASLYDELAISAEGYSVGGVPVAREQLRDEMPLAHKLYAMIALFSADDCDPLRRKNFTGKLDFLGMKKTRPAPRVEVH